MPVDRQGRDQLVDAIASFLWGTVHVKGLVAASDVACKRSFPDIHGVAANPADDALYSIALFIRFNLREMGELDGETALKGWNQLIRAIAFLKSDFQYHWSNEPSKRPYFKGLVALVLVVVLIYNYSEAFRTGNPTTALGTWWLIGLIWEIVAIKRFGYSLRETERNQGPSFVDAYPFETLEQWEWHRHLADADHLPTFRADSEVMMAMVHHFRARIWVSWAKAIIVLPIGAVIAPFWIFKALLLIPEDSGKCEVVERNAADSAHFDFNGSSDQLNGK